MMIGLLGCGVVGSGVKRIVDEAYTSETASLCIKKILVKEGHRSNDKRETCNIDDILNDSDIDTVVECIGGLEPAHTYVKKVLEAHKNAVTSNKKMLAVYGWELFSLAKRNHVCLLYEASVAGGIPWMKEISRIRRIDDIVSFEGIMNGTTNYILSSMNEEKTDFGSALHKAQELGYAERDPSDDIDGLDVRYKTALTAMSAFDVSVNPEDIPCFGIRYMKEEDMQFAQSEGLNIKLLGRGKKENDRVTLNVMPCFIKDKNVLAHIQSNYNAVSCVSETLGKAMFIGQGAGSLPTAHAIVQDLLDLQYKCISPVHAMKKVSLKYDKEGIFYIRTKCNVDAIAHQKAGKNAILTEKVSLEKAVSLIQEDKEAFIGEVL